VRFCEADDSEDAVTRTVMRAVGSAQASEHRRHIVRNAVAGKRGATANGYWTTRAPFGYRRAVVWPVGRERVLEDGHGKGVGEKIKLAPGPAPEVALVRWAFDAMRDGAPIKEIAARLQREAPTRRWSHGVLYGFFRNPAYVGDTVTQRRSAENVRRGVWKNPPSEWVRVTATHEPLVSRNTFAAVQARLALLSARPRVRRGAYLVSGLIRCTDCGGYYTGGGTGGRAGIPYYKCSGAERGACRNPMGTVARSLLETAILNCLTEELASPRVEQAIRAAVDASLRSPPAGESQRVALERELAKLESRRDRLVVALGDGTLLPAEARTHLDTVRVAIETTTRELAALTRERPAPRALLRERDQLLSACRRFREVISHAPPHHVRALLTPWIADATFDKRSRDLRLSLYRVPADLLKLPSPRRASRQKVHVRTIRLEPRKRQGARTVNPVAERIG
jgi:hypothetical protein